MKINKVIFAVDDNPKYDGLWPIVSEVCNKVLRVTPVLFRITDKDSDFYNDKWGIVKDFKSVEGVKKGVQSQLIRMWGTRFFKDEVCLISDIDMLMIDKSYFIDQVQSFNQEDLVIYCSDGYDVTRPECVGIYGPDRYPICYNAATGETFNKVLGTDVDFRSYLNLVLSFGFPDFDSDEMFFGNRVNQGNHGVNVVKLKRGFYSKFKCPGRIDRIDDSQFNLYNRDALLRGDYIDCHLARPYSRYKDEIEALKDLIISRTEVYLIGCHIDNPKQLALLSDLIYKLRSAGKKYVISSHTMIPEFLVKGSLGFVYDSVNPKWKTWELDNPNKFTINLGPFSVTSPYITYGRNDYYHVGVLRLLINGLNYIKNLDFNTVHWIEYDATPDFVEDEANTRRLMDCDFVFYGIGSKFSFNLRSVHREFLESNNSGILKLLKENDWVAERVISNCLIQGKKIFIDVAGKPEFFGQYSHNGEIPYDWSLLESESSVDIFINNPSDKKRIFQINTSENRKYIEVNPYTWIINEVSKKDILGKIEITEGGKTILSVDLADTDIYNRLVRSVKIN